MFSTCRDAGRATQDKSLEDQPPKACKCGTILQVEEVLLGTGELMLIPVWILFLNSQCSYM